MEINCKKRRKNKRKSRRCEGLDTENNLFILQSFLKSTRNFIILVHFKDAELEWE